MRAGCRDAIGQLADAGDDCAEPGLEWRPARLGPGRGRRASSRAARETPDRVIRGSWTARPTWGFPLGVRWVEVPGARVRRDQRPGRVKGRVLLAELPVLRLPISTGELGVT